ncbi:MAG: glycosyltransferase [Candidatus Binataceae bacterium]
MSAESEISIAMAVYNGERFILEQLKSLAHQTHLPDEMVISDDCSTDRTVGIITEFALHAPFSIKVLTNDKNVGCTKNYERAIRDCSGDIIFLCDCDDVWYPQKIATMEQAFNTQPKAGVAICDADLVDERARPLGQRLWENRAFTLPRALEKISAGRSFNRSIPCYGPCIAFRARYKSLVLPLPDGPSFRLAGQDTFITWCIVGAGAAGIALVNEPLLAYRQHPAQMTKQMQESPLPRWKARNQRPLTFLVPLIERLESNAARELCVNGIFRDAALGHWRSRVCLPAGKMARLPVVLRELLTGRYHMFSDGLKTAAKDLLFVR